MNIVAVVQARLSSRRLPGKVLLDLAGEPMLARVVERTRRAKSLSAVAVATSLESADDPIATLCAERGWPCCRGSLDDVLDRYYGAARELAADAVVRVTSDCPLIDPELIDRVVGEFTGAQPEVQYASNVVPRRTFPRGLDVEVIRLDSLARAWFEDRDPASREHVTPYIYRHPERFVLHEVSGDIDLSAMRWTVDTPEDRQLALEIYRRFGHDKFGWREVVELIRREPALGDINRNVVQKRLP